MSNLHPLLTHKRGGVQRIPSFDRNLLRQVLVQIGAQNGLVLEVDDGDPDSYIESLLGFLSDSLLASQLLAALTNTRVKLHGFGTMTVRPTGTKKVPRSKYHPVISARRAVAEGYSYRKDGPLDLDLFWRLFRKHSLTWEGFIDDLSGK